MEEEEGAEKKQKRAEDEETEKKEKDEEEEEQLEKTDCESRSELSGRQTSYYCKTCSGEPSLCPVPCFELYHTRLIYKVIPELETEGEFSEHTQIPFCFITCKE